MAELPAPLLEEPDGERAVGDYLAGHREEMAGLVRWSRINDFDRAAVNHALHTDPGTGGPTA